MKTEHIIGAVVVAFLVGLLVGHDWSSRSGERPIIYEYIFSGGSGDPSGSGAAEGAAGLFSLRLGGSPSVGPKDAKVTIVESSDFQ